MAKKLTINSICWASLVLVFTNCLFVAAVRAEVGFRVGAATADITPELGVSLDGPISKNGPVTGIHDRLHARAIVFDDGQTRIAIVICDACMIGPDVVAAAKIAVHQRTGLRVDRMLIAATHTHAAVRATHIGTGTLDDKYHRQLAQRIADAIVEAEQNLRPARVGFGSFDKAEFLRCRRFLCKQGSVQPNPFGQSGERIKSVSGKSASVIEPAGPVDPQFSILSIEHSDGRSLAVLGNFSVHYCGGYQRGIVSADYFGHFARAMEMELTAGEGRSAFVGVMSNGTSGNTGSIERGGQNYRPFEWMQVSARILAAQAVQTIRRIEHREDVTLGMQESELEIAIRRPDGDRLKWAEDILADQNTNRVHPHRWTRVYANETVQLSKYAATMKIKLQAIRIGPIVIAAAPCEVFAETGLAIKKASNHSHTFTIELANGYGGYLPPPEQHELGGYETWPARSSFLEVQAEPKIRDELLRLLQRVEGP
jgi:hypothetical protein